MSKLNISDEIRRITQETAARKNKGDFVKGQAPWNKGTRQFVNKICLSCKKEFVVPKHRGVAAKYCTTKCVPVFNKGKKQIQTTGDKNPNWQGGTTKFQSRLAKERDNFTCQICGLKDAEIVLVDHIRPKAIRPDLIYVLDNLMTLCPNCHARKTIIDVKNISVFKKGKRNE